TVMLLIDVSGSRNFGTLSQTKRDMAAEVAATLAFSTIENNDKVGVLFFSDRVEKYIPPKKGKRHVLHIIHELLSFEPEHTGTDINQALHYFRNAQKRRTTAFLISDLQDDEFAQVPERIGNLPLTLTSRKHDMNVIQIYDHLDAEIPNVGLMKVRDAETGERMWIDTSMERVRTQYARDWNDRQERLENLFTRTGVREVSIRTDEDYVKKLKELFHS
ncbi:MAG: VWA domain-containing protein, partial [Bacteroidaceae bacterium]|nr:VWA domain-containing protein [Bacteroidaceae bacterium]